VSTKAGLIFQEPKSEDSNRIIHPPAEVMGILEKHLNIQEERKRLLGDDYKDTDLINCYPDGRPIDPRYFSHKFSDVLKNHGLKHIRFHDLRHSCATLMLTSGVEMKVASQILGHSSIGITADLYTHVLAETKKDAAIKIGNEIFGNNTE